MSTAIDDSTALGKQVSAIMIDPTKLSRKELVDKLGQLAAQQEEIAVRAGRLEPPGTLEDEQTVFSTGMRVRANGFGLLRTAMLGALANKKVSVKDIAALDGYFSGPDAYYQELVYAPARETMAEGRRHRRRRAHLDLLPHLEGPRHGDGHGDARQRRQVDQADRHPRGRRSST